MRETIPFPAASPLGLLVCILALDNRRAGVLILGCCPNLVPSMSHKRNSNNLNDGLIKFVAPRTLKHALQILANERNITLSWPMNVCRWLQGQRLQQTQSSAHIGN